MRSILMVLLLIALMLTIGCGGGTVEPAPIAVPVDLEATVEAKVKAVLTAVPTIVPTAVPTPNPTPVPAPTAVPAVVATSSPAATVVDPANWTPTPTHTPTQVPTVTSTNTPTPTATPAIPTATPIPVPTATPSPTPIATIQHGSIDIPTGNKLVNQYSFSVDPNNPPRIATHNFIDLGPYIGISKLRSAYGHDYTTGDDEHDPEGKSCRSMKHYLDAYTSDQRWAGNFGSYDTKGNVKFYAPADGMLTDIRSNTFSEGTEYQFMIQATQYPTIKLGFHHVDLLEELRSGGSVVAGQHLGYIARPHGQGEIVVMVMVGMRMSEYISFFDIMTDDVFAMYQARGINSRAEMSITKEERDANPIQCDTDFEQSGKFIAQGDPETFAKWQSGPDNWVWLPK